MRSAVRAIALILAVLLLAGCSTTRIGSAWSEPGRPAKPYRDLLVFGVASKDKVRRAFEDSFVAELKGRGVRARAGSALLPAGAQGDANALKRAVRAAGADGFKAVARVEVDATGLCGSDRITGRRQRIADSRANSTVSPIEGVSPDKATGFGGEACCGSGIR